jgi:DNA transformation protein
MGALNKMPNISTIIEAKLIQAGVKTPEDLQQMGSRAAFCKIREKDPSACLNMLCALEGAVRGVRWFSMPNEVKAELKEYYESL